MWEWTLHLNLFVWVVILAKLSKPFMDGDFVKKSIVPKESNF
jgi:hypothetical protein